RRRRGDFQGLGRRQRWPEPRRRRRTRWRRVGTELKVLGSSVAVLPLQKVK
ncbi:hypothetical protein LINPERPRIM_LOCUS20980, partial [Linum perenne]